ncbi:MAG: Ig-like domain-containing protein [Lachnospiraceae bacterium]
MRKCLKKFLWVMCVGMLLSLMVPMPVWANTKTKVLKYQQYDQTLTMERGTRVQLQVKKLPKKLEGRKLQWGSNHKNVVSVTKSGVIKSLKNGKAVISVRVKTKNGFKRISKLNVTVKTTVSSVLFANADEINELKDGESFRLQTKVLPAQASNKKLMWSSSNTEVATVDQNGKITAIASGRVKITATATDGSGKKATKSIDVLSYIQSIKLSLHSKSAYCTPINTKGVYTKKGTAFTLDAKLQPQKVIDSTLSWTTSNPQVATVDEEGNVIATGSGIAMITASAIDGSKKQGTFNVYVGKLQKEDCMFIAHRGRSEIAPENSLSAFQLALQDNYDAVELDIWKTADDDFVVSHDQNLKNSCGLDVKVTDMTLAEAMQCRITSGSNIEIYSNEYIPSLEQVLTIASAYPDKELFIELKQVMSQQTLEKFLTLIRKYGMEDRVKVISFYTQNMATIRALTELGGDTISMEYLCSKAPTEEILSNCVKYQMGIGIKYTCLAEDAVTYLKSNGLFVNVWSVPNYFAACHLVHTLHVDAVSSNYRFLE